MLKLNVGCGRTPVQGWRNYDNSISVRLSKMPKMLMVMDKLGLLSETQLEFINIAMQNDISYANASKHLPHADGTVDVIYSSHMIEHLDKNEADAFLKEAFRVLRPGGILRISTPDLKKLIEEYTGSGDAEEFIQRTHLTRDKNNTIVRKVKYLLVGDRHHQNLYDAKSLQSLLESNGFINIKELPAGTTMITDPGDLNLHERESESLYMEATR